MTLGQRIQELRKGLGLSQEGLGEQLGVSRQAISRWEMDGAVPEVDKLITMAKLFNVSLDELLQGKKPKESEHTVEAGAGGGAKPVRLLAALCVVLTLVSVALLGSTLYFHRQVMGVLDPPRPPDRPVTALEYAFVPNYEDMTYDLAFKLTGEELKGWDVTLSVTTLLGSDQERVTEAEDLNFRGGTAQFQRQGLPFGYHRPILVYIQYTKGELQSEQGLLTLEPTGRGKPWEIVKNVQEYGYVPEENPSLLESE